MTYDHTENKKLYCQDWMETERPWERWEVSFGSSWLALEDHPGWVNEREYRRIDPYRALKEAAADPTKQICVAGGNWMDSGFVWYWNEKPEHYEIRDKPPEPKPVKYLCYEGASGMLHWVRDAEGITVGSHMVRIPEFDKVLP